MSVFLDHASTSPLRAVAREALAGALEILGNPSSVHAHGQRTREILEDARDQVAAACGANRSEVVFLSGGTEANNQTIKGIYWRRNQADPNRKVIVSAGTEHHALIDPIIWLVQHEGAELVELPAARNGEIDLGALAALIESRGDEIALISLMWLNNETGVITDITKVTQLAATKDIPVHSDAVAALGHIPIDFAASGLTAMSISGHKVGSPIGIGALVVRRDFNPVSLLHGGGQERGLRSGTMNYPLAAAFGAAAKEAVAELRDRQARLRLYRDKLESEILAAIPEAIVTAAGTTRADHNAHIIFPGVGSDSMLFLLDQRGISVSAGSACQAGVLGPSHVLLAMGHSPEDASSCLRITLGYTTTESDIEALILAVKEVHPQALAASRI